MTARTGWVFDERYLWHDTGRAGGFAPAGGWLEPDRHVENGDVKRRMRNLVDVSGLLRELVPIAPRPATEDELRRLHTAGHVDRMREMSAGTGGDAGDGETPVGRGSYDIARLAVGGAIAAVDAVLDRTVDNAYVLCRPPGHHALSDQGMGFCVFGNAALAALHALERHELDRVAVVDWDVHHGNGTEAAFYDDPRVLTISIHQEELFPAGSGRVAARGAGAGEGANINVPLPAGSGWGAYEAAMRRIVIPALRGFRPQLILIASGYDAGAWDPLGRMMLSSDAFRDMTLELLDCARGVCDGAVVALHEGGYSPFASPFCGLAVVEALADRRTDVLDPYSVARDAAGQALLSHQERAIDAAAARLPLLRPAVQPGESSIRRQ